MSGKRTGREAEAAELVARLRQGGAATADELLPLVYSELRFLAGAILRRERPGHTLQPTALVHEAALRLLGTEGSFEHRAHFIGVAARAMRQVLVDHARQRHARKRGGGATRVSLVESDSASGPGEGGVDVLVLDDALTRLAELSGQQARIVELRFFGGLERAEIAQLLGLSVHQVDREWRMARAWLHGELGDGNGC